MDLTDTVASVFTKWSENQLCECLKLGTFSLRVQDLGTITAIQIQDLIGLAEEAVEVVSSEGGSWRKGEEPLLAGGGASKSRHFLLSLWEFRMKHFC